MGREIEISTGKEWDTVWGPSIADPDAMEDVLFWKSREDGRIIECKHYGEEELFRYEED